MMDVWPLDQFGLHRYSLQYASVKLAKKHSEFWTISFFRGAVGTLAALMTALLSKNRRGSLLGANPSNIKWLLLRGVLGGITIISAFIAVTVRVESSTTIRRATTTCLTLGDALPQEVEISHATVIIATSTLWTAALAVLLERGTWKWGDTFAAIFCLLGVVLVVKPTPIWHPAKKKDDHNPLLGLCCAVLSAVSQAGVNMTIRRIKEEDTSVITLYAMVVE